MARQRNKEANCGNCPYYCPYWGLDNWGNALRTGRGRCCADAACATFPNFDFCCGEHPDFWERGRPLGGRKEETPPPRAEPNTKGGASWHVTLDAVNSREPPDIGAMRLEAALVACAGEHAQLVRKARMVCRCPDVACMGCKYELRDLLGDLGEEENPSQEEPEANHKAFTACFPKYAEEGDVDPQQLFERMNQIFCESAAYSLFVRGLPDYDLELTTDRALRVQAEFSARQHAAEGRFFDTIFGEDVAT